MTLTREELLKRVQAGEALRWVPRNISNIPFRDYDPKGGERDLFLGSDRLCNKTQLLTCKLQLEGELYSRKDGPIIFYELAQDPADVQRMDSDKG